MNYRKEIKRLLADPMLSGYKMSLKTKARILLYALKTPFKTLRVLMPEILKGKMEWIVIRELLFLPISFSLSYFWYLPNRYRSAKADYLLYLKKDIAKEIAIRYPEWWEFEKC